MLDKITEFAYVTAPNTPANSNLSEDPRRPMKRDDYFLMLDSLPTFAGMPLTLQPGEKKLFPLFIAERFPAKYPGADFLIEVTPDRIEMRPVHPGLPCPFCSTNFPDRAALRAHAMECAEGPATAGAEPAKGKPGKDEVKDGA